MKKRLFYILCIIFGLVACDRDKSSEAPAKTERVASIAVDELAKQCGGCHGTDGVSGLADAPFIAGQHAEYLTTAMLHYVNGNREHAVMKSLFEPLTVGDLVALGKHYSDLRTEWRPETGPVKLAPDREAVTAGKSLARTCAPCHGKDGHSTRAGIPSLAGMPAPYFIKALQSYLSGERKNELMDVFKHSLKDDDVMDLATYYASLKSKKSTLATSSDKREKAPALATTTCAGCHGIDGNSLDPTMPSLTGHDADYLYAAMRAYRDGARDNAMMRAATSTLNDKTMKALATYYAKQTPQLPTSAKSADPITAGEKIAQSCNGCHGDAGNSRTPGIPSLSGLHPNYLTTAITAYQAGSRSHAIMKNLVDYLKDTDIESVSFYYATRSPGTPSTSKPEQNEAVMELVATCNGCHGDNGNSAKPATPSLAGQQAQYLADAVKTYRDGQRQHAEMANAVKALADPQIATIANYYAAIERLPAKFREPEPVEVLAEKCDRCHGKDGYSTDPNRPILAKQKRDYLVKALLDYKHGRRKNSMMYAMSEPLSLSEINAISDFYAGQ